MQQPDDPGIDPDYNTLAEPLAGGNRVVALAAVIFIGFVIAGLIGLATRWLS
ncbi:hypothetical protein [Labrys sp. ZIDIC5]|uniref:hypothetical protein n=1 Tax=Labrys sedimenti TaxID=3106036 RepID=UPI002ACA704B|nr:hypothetical protein [Labrys sp. ZIDIC5]MDZ5448905.1 hypothetical protein [Labrys sp. ZIDIC5]